MKQRNTNWTYAPLPITVILFILGINILAYFWTPPPPPVPYDYRGIPRTDWICGKAEMAVASNKPLVVALGSSTLRDNLFSEPVREELSLYGYDFAKIAESGAILSDEYIMYDYIMENGAEPEILIISVNNFSFPGGVERVGDDSIYATFTTEKFGIKSLYDVELPGEISLKQRLLYDYVYSIPLYRMQYRVAEYVTNTSRYKLYRDFGVERFSQKNRYPNDGYDEDEIDEYVASLRQNMFTDDRYFSPNAQTELLAELIRKCKARDIHPIILLMPENPAAESAYPEGFIDGCRESIYDMGVEVWDFADTFDATYFRDHAHLTEEGRLEFTEMFNERLKYEIVK